jgi:hypothetical protein
MRALAWLLLLAGAGAGAGVARADMTVPTEGAPPFPIGPRCARALEAARDAFSCGCTDEHFPLKVDAQGVTGEYRCSDQCGVFVHQSFELARDARSTMPWRMLQRRDGPYEKHRRVTRRAGGWRATIDVVEAGLPPGNFEEVFERALDTCLDYAAIAR